MAKKPREKKKREQGPLERKVATAVAGAVKHRQETAKAAGHGGSWLTRWLGGEQTATLDEMQVVVKKVLQLPLSSVLNAPDTADALDWEVFALMLGLKEPWQKAMARDLVQRVAVVEPDTPARTASPTRSPRRGGSR